jgi:hypothetical protein
MLKVLKMQLLNQGKHQDKEEQMKNPEAEEKTPDPPKKQNPETEIKTPEPPKKQNPSRHPRKIGETDRRTHHICHPFAVDAGKYRRRMDIQ